MPPVLKIINYTLLPGVDERDFLAASRAAEGDLRTLDGFRDRRLLRAEDGRWSDAVLWDSREAADRSEDVISTMPECASCIALMDHTSFETQHLELVQSSDLAGHKDEPWQDHQDQA